VLHVGLRVGIGGFGQQIEQLDQVSGTFLDRPPQVDLPAQALRLTQRPLRRALVVPEAGLAGLGVELPEPRLSGGEVKDAPKST
jgi:hypothetical protein